MTKFKSTSIAESIFHAIRGLKLAFSSQKNLVIEIIISCIVIIAALFLKFSLTDLVLVIIICSLVLICELFNSVIEFTLDAVYKNNYSKLVEMAKDISAGVVLFIICVSAIAGLLLFGSYIL